MNACPACNSPDADFLGTLGSLDHYRCCDCGIDYSAQHEEWEESEEWEDSDSEDDGDYGSFHDGEALASAGFGTDEDYGHYGGDD
jgi:Zn ribbon nucleic-acid-binding protein